MIKIKSPAVSEAGNRCAGRSETVKTPGSSAKSAGLGKENEAGGNVPSTFFFFFFLFLSRHSFRAPTLLRTSAELTSESVKIIETDLRARARARNLDPSKMYAEYVTTGEIHAEYVIRRGRDSDVTLRLTATPVFVREFQVNRSDTKDVKIRQVPKPWENRRECADVLWKLER